MTNPETVLGEFDDAFRPYLPLLGAIAVDATRIEFGLALLRSMVTNHPPSETLNAFPNRNVKEIKQAMRSAHGTEREPYWRAVADWATRAERLLDRRGDLMHSMWTIGSDVETADLVRVGWLTDAEAAAIDPTAERPVFADRLRGNQPTVEWTQSGLAEFALELHEHMSVFPSMYEAAGVAAGVSPVTKSAPPQGCPWPCKGPRWRPLKVPTCGQ